MAEVAVELSIRPATFLHHLKNGKPSVAVPILYEHLLDVRLAIQESPLAAPTLWTEIKMSGLLEELFHQVASGLPWDDPETDPVDDALLLVYGSLLYLNTLCDYRVFGELAGDDKDFVEQAKATFPNVICRLISKAELSHCTDPLCCSFFYWPVMYFFSDYYVSATATGDNDYLDVVKVEAVYSFILELYFNPRCYILRVPPNYRVTSSRAYHILESKSDYLAGLVKAFDPFEAAARWLNACDPIITTLQYDSKDLPWIESIGEAIGLKYGNHAIAQRCYNLFDTVESGNLARFRSILKLSMLLLYTSTIHMALFDVRLQMVLLQGFWKAVKSKEDQYQASRSLATDVSGLLSVLLCANPALASRIDTADFNTPTQIHHFQDVVLLMGRSALDPETKLGSEEEFGLNDLAVYVHMFYRKHRRTDPAVCEKLLTTCRHVLRSLGQFVHSKTTMPDSHLEQLPDRWVLLVRTIVGNRNIQDFAAWESRTYGPGKGVDGCSWVKCIRSSMRLQDRILRCSRCNSAHYCSAICQRMDWQEGKHREKCAEKLTMTLALIVE